jgi:hypothetical protein
LDELENKKQGLVDFKHYKAREILAQIKYVETHLKAIPNLLEVEKALIKELETI